MASRRHDAPAMQLSFACESDSSLPVPRQPARLFPPRQGLVVRCAGQEPSIRARQGRSSRHSRARVENRAQECRRPLNAFARVKGALRARLAARRRRARKTLHGSAWTIPRSQPRSRAARARQGCAPLPDRRRGPGSVARSGTFGATHSGLHRRARARPRRNGRRLSRAPAFPAARGGDQVLASVTLSANPSANASGARPRSWGGSAIRGIAQVHGAGTALTEHGEMPWIAMEYVRGEPLLDHASRLELRGRIELMAELCHAGRARAREGRRALRPQAVERARRRRRRRIRVLDFGVARLAGGRGQDRAAHAHRPARWHARLHEPRAGARRRGTGRRALGRPRARRARVRGAHRTGCRSSWTRTTSCGRSARSARSRRLACAGCAAMLPATSRRS